MKLPLLTLLVTSCLVAPVALAEDGDGWHVMDGEDALARAFVLRKQGRTDEAREASKFSLRNAVRPAVRRRAVKAAYSAAIAGGDLAGATDILESGALGGDSFATRTLIRLQLDGKAQPRQIARLIPIYEARAQGGTTSAAILLGRIYRNGEAGARDLPRALRWFDVAASANNTTGRREAVQVAAILGNSDLAERYAAGLDRKRRAREYSRLAKAFAAGADDFPRSADRAALWQRRAVLLDPSLAPKPKRPKKPKGPKPPRFSELANLSTQALEQRLTNGDNRAALVLARRFEQAANAEERARAIPLFVRALDNGLEQAVSPLQSALAMEEPGSQTAQTIVTALDRASDRSVTAASLALVRLYTSGGGVTADPAKAVTYLTRAAKDGSAEASLQLGLRYAAGTGVPQDVVLARKYLTSASAQGSPVARAALQQLPAQ